MPTQSTTYNSRVTDEALEKRFRDTFRSQGGAELVDDLYAQGVIVPIVDFTAAATGQQLSENLQTAWDFSTGSQSTFNTTDTVVATSGFWKVSAYGWAQVVNPGGDLKMQITDLITTKTIFEVNSGTLTGNEVEVVNFNAVVFLRAGDSLIQTAGGAANIITSYRQIATVNGDLVNPTGFTSS